MKCIVTRAALNDILLLTFLLLVNLQPSFLSFLDLMSLLKDPNLTFKLL
jgi:hypothetical protein